MANVSPMFHMDEDYMWRWYITSALGVLVAMSTRAFFAYEDARKNYADVMRPAA